MAILLIGCFLTECKNLLVFINNEKLKDIVPLYSIHFNRKP